jgi:hypothetical protein
MTRMSPFSIAIAILLLIPCAVWAQATAEVNGRVADQSGAVLPGVTITVTQTDTGLVRSVVTGADGSYLFSNLPTGPYRLEAALQGFRTYVQTGIVLQVGGKPTINVALAVGALEEAVTVEGAAPIVDVRSAGIRDVVEQERIVELPLQGRQVTDLIVLAGAAVNLGSPVNRSYQSGVQISVAGGLSSGVAYTLDGAIHNDTQTTDGLPLPFPDALQEFSVVTSGAPAQYGMNTGASVNAVTKSGTINHHGNGFEFVRDARFNATSPFAAIGPDGKRLNDGLKRNQFGGTIGGPVVHDKLFFFGGFQLTPTRVTPTDNIAFVPTPAMLAGDFTAITSPACNNGRQIALRAPFVNNTINPAQFSPAALNLAKRLPATTDPCGKTTFAPVSNRDENQYVGRVDYQRNANDTIFGRYLLSSDVRPSALDFSENILVSPTAGTHNYAQAATVGDTRILSANTVNNMRFAFNRTTINRENKDYFQPSDLGINAFNYSPTKEMLVTVTGGFSIGAATSTRGIAATNTYLFSDDLTLVRGRHQIAFGGALGRWHSLNNTWARGGGTWTFSGTVTGLGLADLLLGRVASLEQGGAGGLTMHQWYQGLYAQDAWRASDRVTVNAGVRWEPFFGQQVEVGGVPNFDINKFKQNVKSAVFVNAPAGIEYPTDQGFPAGRAGFNRQWLNFSPRAGVAWDVFGTGRLAVRSSYALAYDTPPGETWFTQASSPPFGNRTIVQDPAGRMDDPYNGNNPHPIIASKTVTFPAAGTFGSINPNSNAPRVQSWNVTVEQQFGTNWGVSASYLGSHSDHLWDTVALNPGVFLGLGPCTLNGAALATCSTLSNINDRRALSLVNPKEGAYFSNLDQFNDLSSQNYRGLKLTFRRRGTALNLNGNYTLGRCFGLENQSSPVFAVGYTNPADPNLDRGYCTANRTHIANMTVGTETPRFGGAMGAVASNWRVSGIVTARSGAPLNITTGQDNAFNGQSNQRVNQISDDVYGAKTLNSYLNRAAFEQPASGTFGNFVRNSLTGPAFWKIDLAVSRLVPLSGAQNVELRLEVFNVTNHFNWGQPVTNLLSSTFGRILTIGGDPRILQFGVKYGF